MNKIKTNKKVLETVNICSNEVPNQEKELVKITGKLTSRIEKKEKHNETYYYGFFKTEGYEQEIPVIFKKVNLIFLRLKYLKKNSQAQLEGT